MLLDRFIKDTDKVVFKQKVFKSTLKFNEPGKVIIYEFNLIGQVDLVSDFSKELVYINSGKYSIDYKDKVKLSEVMGLVQFQSDFVSEHSENIEIKIPIINQCSTIINGFIKYAVILD